MSEILSNAGVHLLYIAFGAYMTIRSANPTEFYQSCAYVGVSLMILALLCPYKK